MTTHWFGFLAGEAEEQVALFQCRVLLGLGA